MGLIAASCGRRARRRVVLAACLAICMAPAAGSCDSRPANASADETVIHAGQRGPQMNVDFIGNATRLDTLLGLRSPATLEAVKRGAVTGPTAGFFRQRYPHYRQFRIGNLFVGYRCTALDFDELVLRGDDGRLQYRFGQTLDMLQMMLDAGIKPHLALTGTPFALVPAGETPLRHPAYGCVNAPAIDLSKAEPRDRMPEWWQLQDAFLGALEKRFGKDELRSWTFATWTEPMNPRGKLAHLVMPAHLLAAGRHDEAVATLLAASIDVAMRHGVRIRLGNLAGPVTTDYPRLIAEIAKLPRGRAYLDYLEGYAVSRYRTVAGADIGHQLDAAFKLLDDARMPPKPLYVDELGDLAGRDGVEPFHAASGLEGGRFAARALARVFSRQDGTPRAPRSVAFWRNQIEPRGRQLFSRPDDYLETPASHAIDLFATMNGHARVAVTNSGDEVLAGWRDDQVKIIMLPRAAAGQEADGTPPRRIAVTGLRAGAEHAITTTTVGSLQGNPIAAFLDGKPDHLQDTHGRFARRGGEWRLASPYWESCYYEERADCAWREKARDIEHPQVRSWRGRSDAEGTLHLVLPADDAAIMLIDVAATR
jgi:hypothetical protein